METSLYEKLGGAPGIRKLVERFYHFMDTLPEARTIRLMHPDLAVSTEKLYFFLSGWTGGPQLFVERYGHPMLRKRHFPFAIGEAERDQWMLCMRKALEEVGTSEPLRSDLEKAFFRIADHMRNQIPTGQSSGQSG